MPRPFKQRLVHTKPNVTYFKPRGIPMYSLEEVVLTVDEFEAVRLSDLEGLYHEEAAKKMGIARQTFSKMLTESHEKIANALVNGKAIKIEGGQYCLNDNNMPETLNRPGRGMGRGRRRRGR